MVLGVLRGRCKDSRSQAEAEDLAEGVIADCFGANGKEPLLALYSGRSPFDRWLKSIAINRLKNLWRSGRWRYERNIGADEEYFAREDIEGSGTASSPEPCHQLECFECAELMGEALIAAFRSLSRREVIFLRLAYLHDVRTSRLAAIWGCSPSTVGRSIERSLRGIRGKTLEFIRCFNEELIVTWEDCLILYERWPNLLAKAGDTTRIGIHAKSNLDERRDGVNETPDDGRMGIGQGTERSRLLDSLFLNIDPVRAKRDGLNLLALDSETMEKLARFANGSHDGDLVKEVEGIVGANRFALRYFAGLVNEQ